MSAKYFPLIGEQAEQTKYPPSCPVYIVDSDTNNVIVASGTVVQCLLQTAPSLQILYEVQINTKLGKCTEIVIEKNVRYQNGCGVMYQNEPAVILGICSIPSSRKVTHDKNYWYSIEIEPATGIIHDVDQADITFLPQTVGTKVETKDVKNETHHDDPLLKGYTKDMGNGDEDTHDDINAFEQQRTMQESTGKVNIPVDAKYPSRVGDDSLLMTSELEQVDGSEFQAIDSNNTSTPKNFKTGDVDQSDQKDNMTIDPSTSELQLVKNPFSNSMFDGYRNRVRKAAESSLQNIPMSSWSNSKICVKYHIGGMCTVGCPYSHDPRELDESKLKELKEWCVLQFGHVSSQVKRSYRVENNHYHPEMFQTFKKKTDYLKSKHEKPQSHWGNHEMCLSYHIHGFCNSSCANANDHRETPYSTLKRLLEWCKECCSSDIQERSQHSLESGEIVSPSSQDRKRQRVETFDAQSVHSPSSINNFYHETMFGQHRGNVKILKKEIGKPKSYWSPNIDMCLAYHLNGRCMNTCRNRADHRECPEEHLRRLLQWCNDVQSRNFAS
ncbi:predicted protein [Chaetoceros tenuissimus]|uniref:C3H1-type domain-containing protein n=1 Tax=Chaetoceros tenuissimus TaxID=426638 RepID=A0AAD3CHJ7_9STRA|nr:predicted protein [Chaetoceros tenuissimus]